MSYRYKINQVDQPLSELRPFRTQARRVAVTGVYHENGSLWATDQPDPRETGQLPPVFTERFRKDQPTYVVYSYDTPIAWVAREGKLRIPVAHYSVTTDQHQKIVRGVWGARMLNQDDDLRLNPDPHIGELATLTEELGDPFAAALRLAARAGSAFVPIEEEKRS